MQSVAQPLDQLDGPLIIDLWATWCGPCIQAMPHLKAIADPYTDRGVRVLGISIDDSETTLRRFLSGGINVPWTMSW